MKFATAAAAFVGTSLTLTSLAFAGSSFSTPLATTPQQTSITLSIPNLNNDLQPAQTLKFTFTLGGPLGSSNEISGSEMVETGTLDTSSPNKFTYTIPLPNYGQKETVWVYTSYQSNNYTYTSTAGPLTDTLPEVPLAALIPLGMAGIWYFNRRRRMQKDISARA